MGNKTVQITRLNAESFKPFGNVIEQDDEPSFQINQGMCDRFHDLADLEFIGEKARANISLALSKPYQLPHVLHLMERHPLGSQAFIPLSNEPFLVIVATDEDGSPGEPKAFLTNGKQGVNYHRNIWHGVLTPLRQEQSFLIVDREGEGVNLEEYHLKEPFIVTDEI